MNIKIPVACFLPGRAKDLSAPRGVQPTPYPIFGTFATDHITTHT